MESKEEAPLTPTEGKKPFEGISTVVEQGKLEETEASTPEFRQANSEEEAYAIADAGHIGVFTRDISEKSQFQAHDEEDYETLIIRKKDDGNYSVEKRVGFYTAAELREGY